MRKFSYLLVLSLFAVILSVVRLSAEPVINLNLLTPTVVCSSGNDTVRYSVTASGIPANTNVVIYQSTDSTFNPYSGQGDSIGYIPGNAIPRDTVNFGSCVKTLGIFIDACGATGQEGKNEYMILTSGTGIKVSNLAINYDPANSNSGDDNDNDINTGTNPCGFKTPNATLISNLQIGSCNASNIIPASPTDSIPPNAIILCFTSDNVTANYSVNGLCNLGYPIYVVQSSCTRTIGAFTNAASCSSTPTTRYRRTLAIDKRQNCQDNFVYDRCGLFDKDGTYAIRQTGTDTARVSNNGIRRNTIDSCGGIDYTQLDFSADTILKFRIPTNFCNDGFHYIKAITHPNGSQPVSNTIQYKLVCNDVTAQSTTSNICSGESALINLSTTDPNATLSWTVSGGTGITGASAGTGSTINQTLINNGVSKDSVTYTVISNDAGCIKTQTIKVVVKNKVAISIGGDTSLCDRIGTNPLQAIGQFDSIRWNTGATTQTINPGQSGVFTVTSYQNGCSATATTNVTNTNIPSTDVSGNGEICNGNNAVLVLNNFNAYDSVRWSNGTNGSQATFTSPANYTLVAYLKGCVLTDQNPIRECDPQDCNPRITGNRAFCDGDSITLNAGSGFTSYIWNTGANTASITVSPATTASYVVTGTVNGISQNDTVVVSVKPLPLINIGNDRSICMGDSVTLTATTNGTSLLWNTGLSSNSIIVKPITTTNYSATATLNSCTNFDGISVTVKPLPNVNFTKVINGANVQIAGPGGNTSYSWNFGDGSPTSTTQNPTHTYATNGKKYITLVSTLNGCTSQKTDSVTIAITAIKNNISFVDKIEVFPNPTDDFVSIQLKSKKAAEFRILLITIDGKIIVSREYKNTTIVNDEISLKNYSSGVYFLQIESENEQATYQLIKN